MKNWLIIWAWLVGDSIQGYTYHRHLTTDPACKHYQAPRAGSRLDRWSRGLACNPCMVSAAFGDHECPPFAAPADQVPPDQGCSVPPEGWWCSREPGHEPPCAARPDPIRTYHADGSTT